MKRRPGGPGMRYLASGVFPLPPSSLFIPLSTHPPLTLRLFHFQHTHPLPSPSLPPFSVFVLLRRLVFFHPPTPLFSFSPSLFLPAYTFSHPSVRFQPLFRLFSPRISLWFHALASWFSVKGIHITRWLVSSRWSSSRPARPLFFSERVLAALILFTNERFPFRVARRITLTSPVVGTLSCSRILMKQRCKSNLPDFESLLNARIYYIKLSHALYAL